MMGCYYIYYHINLVSLPDFWTINSISYMDVSENSGTPKSSILIGFSIIIHPFWGTPIFGNIHIFATKCFYQHVVSPPATPQPTTRPRRHGHLEAPHSAPWIVPGLMPEPHVAPGSRFRKIMGWPTTHLKCYRISEPSNSMSCDYSAISEPWNMK